MTFGSLFAGIGGFDLGLERAGMECRWQVEIDDYAKKVLQKHWPAVRRWGDVRNFPPPTSIADIEDWKVDLICGGDPCQENSNARRMGTCESPSLGSEFIRVIDELRPRFVLRENPATTRTDAPWPWQRFRNELECLGYAVVPFRLRSCCIGLDHRRERMFLFGELSNIMQEGLQTSWQCGKTARQAESKSTVSTPSGIHRPLRTSFGRRDIHGVSRRVDRIKCLGNAVVPQVAEWIGRRIIKISERKE